MQKVLPDHLIHVRDVDDALREMHEAIIAVNATMQALAARFPGVTVVAGIDLGEAPGALAYTQHKAGTRFNSTAMQAAMTLAKIVASLPDELADAFRIELNFAQEKQRLEAEMREAVAQALRAGAEERR